GRLRTRRVTVRTDHTVTGVASAGDGGLTVTAETETGPVVEQARTVVLSVHPGRAYRLLGRAAGAERRRAARTRPAWAPVVSHIVSDGAGSEGSADPTETIEHVTRAFGPGGPAIRWTRPLPDGRVLTSEHDW